MLDKYAALTNGGQTLTNLDSTGVVSESVLDVETGGVDGGADLLGWLNIAIRSASFSGGTEGLNFTFMTSDSETFASGNVDLVSSGTIPAAEAVAGKKFSFGFISRGNVLKYVALWAKAITTTFTGTIVFDAWISHQPDASPLNAQVNN